MRILTRFLLLATFAPAGYSQSVLYSWDADSASDRFGESISGAGDVKGTVYPT